MSKLLVTKYKTPTGEYTYATMSVQNRRTMETARTVMLQSSAYRYMKVIVTNSKGTITLFLN